MGRRGILMAGIAVTVLAAAGCHGGTVEKAGAASIFHLQTGECFHSSAGTAGRTVQVQDVSPLACTDAHDGEVFAVFSHPAARGVAYPGDEAVADFPAYTGATYDDSDLEVASIRPDKASWSDKNDREVGCVLYKKGATLSSSRRKA